MMYVIIIHSKLFVNYCQTCHIVFVVLYAWAWPDAARDDIGLEDID